MPSKHEKTTTWKSYRESGGVVTVACSCGWSDVVVHRMVGKPAVDLARAVAGDKWKKHCQEAKG